MEETLYKRVGLPEIGAPDLDARPRHHGRWPEVGAVDDAPAVVGDPERHRRREQVHHVADYPPQHQAVPRHLWRELDRALGVSSLCCREIYRSR